MQETEKRERLQQRTAKWPQGELGLWSEMYHESKKRRTSTWKRGSVRQIWGLAKTKGNPDQRAWGLDSVRLAALGCAKRPWHCAAMSAPLVRTRTCPEPSRTLETEQCRETDNKFHYLFQVQRKETYYYLPTCIECVPVFYCKRKIVVAL